MFENLVFYSIIFGILAVITFLFTCFVGFKFFKEQSNSKKSFLLDCFFLGGSSFLLVSYVFANFLLFLNFF